MTQKEMKLALPLTVGAERGEELLHHRSRDREVENILPALAPEHDAQRAASSKLGLLQAEPPVRPGVLSR